MPGARTIPRPSVESDTAILLHQKILPPRYIDSIRKLVDPSLANQDWGDQYYFPADKSLIPFMKDVSGEGQAIDTRVIMTALHARANLIKIPDERTLIRQCAEQTLDAATNFEVQRMRDIAVYEKVHSALPDFREIAPGCKQSGITLTCRVDRGDSEFAEFVRGARIFRRPLYKSQHPPGNDRAAPNRDDYAPNAPQARMVEARNPAVLRNQVGFLGNQQSTGSPALATGSRLRLPSLQPQIGDLAPNMSPAIEPVMQPAPQLVQDLSRSVGGMSTPVSATIPASATARTHNGIRMRSPANAAPTSAVQQSGTPQPPTASQQAIIPSRDGIGRGNPCITGMGDRIRMVGRRIWPQQPSFAEGNVWLEQRRQAAAAARDMINASLVNRNQNAEAAVSTTTPLQGFERSEVGR